VVPPPFPRCAHRNLLVDTPARRAYFAGMTLRHAAAAFTWLVLLALVALLGIAA